MSDEYLEERIRELGFRVTPQRQLILEAVMELGEKASIEEITARVRSKSAVVSQSTIYRTLEIFGAKSLVHINVLKGQRVYEVASEKFHHHMICQNCWSDEKIPHDVIEAFVESVDEHYRFLAQPKHLFLLGLCKFCREEEEKKQKKARKLDQ